MYITEENLLLLEIINNVFQTQIDVTQYINMTNATPLRNQMYKNNLVVVSF